MRIAFVRHRSVADEIIPPLYYGYLAALADRHEVLLLDQLRDRYPDRTLVAKLRGFQPQLVGFNLFTKDIGHLRELLMYLRPRLPGVTFLMGGPQMSVLPVETFLHFRGLLDFGFAGEAEIGFPRFIRWLAETGPRDALMDIPNLVWANSDTVVCNPRQVVADLDTIPFPRWDLMPPLAYPKAPHGAFLRQYPVAQLITSRGCPHQCTFCAAGALTGRTVRYRSIANVIAEILHLHHSFGVREIHIEDDNFSSRRERVVEFAESLLALDLGISWAFPNGLRLENLDDATLALMKRAGCYAMNVGVESGNAERLRRIRKNTTPEQLRQHISRVKKAGIDIGGFFIIGFPDETEAESLETIEFTRRTELDRISFSYFQPYPGSAESAQLAAKGEYVFDIDTSRHSLHHISYVPRTLPRNTLKRLRRKAFFRFYLRRKIFCKLLREVESVEHLLFIIRRGVRWLWN